jgi:predicted HTH domain antitoxin
MTIELPDVTNLKVSTKEAQLDFAVGLYTGKHASLGRAAQVAGMPKILFMQELGKRGVAMHYTMEALEHDIQMAHQLSRKRKAA